jgi:hypothetical protein
VAGPRCSELARALGEPFAGTASEALAFLVVEQPGPWGRDAVRQSHLDPAVGSALADRSAELPVTVLLARRVGHHADHHVRPAPRQVWAAWTGGPSGAGAWLEHAVVDDVAPLLDLDLAALAEGRSPGLGAPVRDDPGLVLVCTNSRRDTCCALAGRPAAERLAARLPGRVWESSHLGGHRFAPTVLRLPTGWVFGSSRAEAMDVATCRGRTALPRAAQAAELAVLRRRGQVQPVPLGAREVAPGRWLVDPDGAPELVEVREEPQLPPRPESCGKEPVSPVSYVAEVADPATVAAAG